MTSEGVDKYVVHENMLAYRSSCFASINWQDPASCGARSLVSVGKNIGRLEKHGILQFTAF